MHGAEAAASPTARPSPADGTHSSKTPLLAYDKDVSYSKQVLPLAEHTPSIKNLEDEAKMGEKSGWQETLRRGEGWKHKKPVGDVA